MDRPAGGIRFDAPARAVNLYRAARGFGHRVAGNMPQANRSAAGTGFQRSFDRRRLDSATGCVDSGIPCDLPHGDGPAGGIRIKPAGQPRNFDRTAGGLEIGIPLELVKRDTSAPGSNVRTGFHGDLDLVMQRETSWPIEPVLPSG